jgi:hypothetical protein
MERVSGVPLREAQGHREGVPSQRTRAAAFEAAPVERRRRATLQQRQCRAQQHARSESVDDAAPTASASLDSFGGGGCGLLHRSTVC